MQIERARRKELEDKVVDVVEMQLRVAIERMAKAFEAELRQMEIKLNKELVSRQDILESALVLNNIEIIDDISYSREEDYKDESMER